MKQIKILLSSALTLLLITGNNAFAAPHYSDFNGRPGFKANKPNMNVFKGQVRKGNVFNITPRRSESRDSGKVEVRNSQQNWGYRVNERGGSNKDIGWWTLDGSNLGNKMGAQEGEAFNPTSKYSISDEPAFVPKPNRGSYTDSGRITYKDDFLNEATIYQNGKDRFIGETGLSDDTHLGSAIGIPPEPEFRSDDNLLPAVQAVQVNGYNCKDISGNCIDKSSPKFGDQEAKAVGDKTWNESLGPDVVTTLEHGPGLHDSYDTGTVVDALQQPKGVPLQFIDGEWVESQSLKPYAWP